MEIYTVLRISMVGGFPRQAQGTLPCGVGECVTRDSLDKYVTWHSWRRLFFSLSLNMS